MKIEFVGTGSIGALQSSACTLIEEDLLVDVPNGIIKKLKQTGHQISKIENCLITHLHGDHFADIPFFMFERFFYKIETPIHIYGPKGIEEKVKNLMDILFPGDYEKIQDVVKVQFIEFEKMENQDIGNGYHITSCEVEHGDCKPAYGYIVEKDNKKVGFSGDSKYCSAINDIIEQSDISVLDMSFMEKGKSAHMGLEDILEIMKKYPNKKIATTHMQDYVRGKAKEKNTENLIIPDDGDYLQI